MDNIKVIYISGAMEGKPKLNFPLFAEAANHYRKIPGNIVLNPAEFGEHEGWTWLDYIKRDMEVIARFKPDYIVLIDGWSESAGSRVEVITAKKLNPKLDIVQYDKENQA